MGKLFRWLDERLDLKSLKAGLLDRAVPDRLTWWHTLGSATLAVFVVQLVTGIVLATYYSPSPDHAYDSIQYLQREVASGSLLRGIHRWGSSAMFILILAHLIRVFSMGAYKYPREVNWLIGVGLFAIVLGFSFTGYLLPWDQKAYWATAVGTNIAGTTPGVGGRMVALLRGGSELGAATLTRFYAFHVLWLPVSLAALVGLHLALVVRQGIAPMPGLLDNFKAPQRTDDERYAGFYQETYTAAKSGQHRFWPDVMGKDAIVAAGAVVVIVILGAVFGAALEPPADPTDTSYIPKPEWYFLPLYQLLKLVPGSMEALVAVGIPTALILALVGLPFFDRNSTRSLVRRPMALVSLTLILGGSGFLLGSAMREAGPEVPPEVGRPLTSKERAGRALFQSQQCGGCHKVRGEGGDNGPDLTAVGLRKSSGWMHSFIESPSRFHGADTRMPAYGPPALSHQEIEEIAQYLSSLRGGVGPEIQPEFHDTFP
ncbi:MAG: cytochrome b N-terminal domain-containing protein [Gemmatimonadetes bacterium]|nr:cytochrome b N-terminal domain-containing protein [Gemmatimonadota bacterium]